MDNEKMILSNTITMLRSKVAELEAQLLQEQWVSVDVALPEVPEGDTTCSKFVLGWNGQPDGVEVTYYNYETMVWEGELHLITHWKPISLPASGKKGDGAEKVD
jgi:hypothetical protein